jgi:hypothetical protein
MKKLDLVPPPITAVASTVDSGSVLARLAVARLGVTAVTCLATGAADRSAQEAALFEAQARRFPSTRAAATGTEDQQRYSLSHPYKIFGCLQLNPLEVMGLEASGRIGVVWMAKAGAEHGWAPGPILRQFVFADPLKAQACRLLGAVTCWRHLKNVQLQTIAEIEARIARGENAWRGKPVTAAQSRLLNWIEELIRAEEPSFDLPWPTNRGDAFDLIKRLGGNPQHHDRRDQRIVERIEQILARIASRETAS